MPSAREVKLRIRSVKNIAQVTRALQAVSASRVRRAMDAVLATRPYATKAWQVLTNLAAQPARDELHPLLTSRQAVDSVIVVLISGERGLAGPYNTNIIRYAQEQFDDFSIPVRYVSVGRKGTELLYRRGKDIMDVFDLPPEPSFLDTATIGRVVVDEFLKGRADEVYLLYTDFINMLRQEPTHKKLLPLEFQTPEGLVQAEYGKVSGGRSAAYLYEPGRAELLDEIVPRFTALQVYQAVLEATASEHAARMVAMKNATDNATELADALQLEYNKVRQLIVTNEMLDIAGGAEALAQANSRS